MQIDDKLLEHLGKLSHLEIDPSKKELMEANLTEILGFVENLKELDTQNIEATFTVSDDALRLRDDIPKASTEITKRVLNNAPKSEDGFFIVPKIIE